MVWFRVPPAAVIHPEYILDLVGNFNLNIIINEFTHTSPDSNVWTSSLEECMWYTSETRVSIPTKIGAMVTLESMEGVSEKIMSVATASFLLGMLKAGNLDLKCFLMGNLVAVTAHWVVLSKIYRVSICCNLWL